MSEVDSQHLLISRGPFALRGHRVTSAHRLLNVEHVGRAVPTVWIVLQLELGRRRVVHHGSVGIGKFDGKRAILVHHTNHGRTSWPTVEPNDQLFSTAGQL